MHLSVAICILTIVCLVGLFLTNLYCSFWEFSGLLYVLTSYCILFSKQTMFTALFKVSVSVMFFLNKHVSKKIEKISIRCLLS